MRNFIDIFESVEWTTVYHGHQDDKTQIHDGKFFTTDYEFAAEYGDVVKYEVMLGNILDTTDEWVAKNVIVPLRIEDPYEGKIVTFRYWKSFLSDTWEMTEHNIDEILSRYHALTGISVDSILITEGGHVNYIVLSSSNMRKTETNTV
jgi:hypothetical protein